MHELKIAKDIIEKAKKKGEVKSIVIEIGEIAHLTKEELGDALKNLISWEIKFNEMESEVKCECGYSGKPKIVERSHDFILIECPECRSIPKIIKGDKIILKKVEVG